MRKVERLAGTSFLLLVAVLMTIGVFFKSSAAIVAIFALVFLYFVYIQRKQETKQNSKVSTVIEQFINYEDDASMTSREQTKREDVVIIIVVFAICLAVGIMMALSIDPHEIMNVNCVFSC